jgi:hypothetical protein
MDRDNMNDTALGPQTRELTKAELDAVSGGMYDAFHPVNATTSIQWGGSGHPVADNAIIGILVG